MFRSFHSGVECKLCVFDAHSMAFFVLPFIDQADRNEQTKRKKSRLGDDYSKYSAKQCITIRIATTATTTTTTLLANTNAITAVKNIRF